MAPGQRSFILQWPYVEGLTMAEATNDLAFMGRAPTASRCPR